MIEDKENTANRRKANIAIRHPPPAILHNNKLLVLTVAALRAALVLRVLSYARRAHCLYTDASQLSSSQSSQSSAPNAGDYVGAASSAAAAASSSFAYR